MKKLALNRRPGTSLIELLLFLGLFAMAGGLLIAILVRTNEERVRQRVAASVEQSGLLLIRSIEKTVRSAERILTPGRGSSGTILALRLADAAEDPAVLALEDGSLMLARASSMTQLSATGITIEDFHVANTSSADDQASILLSFTVTRPIPIGGSARYVRTFAALIALPPDDIVSGNACGCPPPSCTEGRFVWNVCTDGACVPSGITVPCSQ